MAERPAAPPLCAIDTPVQKIARRRETMAIRVFLAFAFATSTGEMNFMFLSVDPETLSLIHVVVRKRMTELYNRSLLRSTEAKPEEYSLTACGSYRPKL